MAHWAQIDENNIVTQVIVGNNDDPDEGYQWLINNLGGTWVQSSFNTYGGVYYNADRTPADDQLKARRFNHAGIGFTYDENRDAFIPPQPYASWVLDEGTCLWVAPIAYPAEGDHVWDEQAGDWVEVTNGTV
jgi:hypothetical protein